MQLKLYYLTIALILTGTLNAQKENRFQFGLQSGNNLSAAGFEQFIDIEGNRLLRYSLGLLVKQDLKKKIKVSWGGLRNYIYFYLHYGLNFAVKGYDYDIGKLNGFANEFAIEVPFLLFLKGGNNQITRSWNKKKINTYTAIGLKWSYSPSKRIEQSIGDIDTDDFIAENTIIGGQNILWHSNYGIMKTSKTGAISSLGIGVNIGFLETTAGQLSFKDGGNTRMENFSRKGSYLSLDLNHFFGKREKIDPSKIKPIIFCPQF